MRFFYRVAQFCSSAQEGSNSQSDSFVSELYHRLRLSFLHASFEATAERLLRVGSIEASSSAVRTTTPVSPVLSTPTVQLSSPPTSQLPRPLVFVSPRSAQDSSDFGLPNACFVPYTGPSGTGGPRVSLVTLPSVWGFFPAPSGSQATPALMSGPPAAVMDSPAGAVGPVMGSAFHSLPGSPAFSAPDSGSQPAASLPQVLFEGSSAASTAPSSP